LKFLPFILRHLQQAWIRTTSTVLAMGLCIFLFSALRTVLARLDDSIQARSPRRLVTTNVMEMSALPPSYAARIERVPGVRRATRIVMFGGFLRGRKQGKAEPGLESDWTSFFQNLAVDAEPYFAMNPELTVEPDQFRDFMADLHGCVMGRKLAEKFGWRTGDHFFLESFASGLRKPDGPFEFVIRGFVDTDHAKYPGTDTDTMLFHYRYLEAALGPMARASLYMVEVDDPDQAPEIAAAIDALFENSSDPTATQTEKAFLSDLLSMFGDVSALLNGVGLAVCFTILLVTANSMSMAARERRTEVAVLKTLGFTSRQVMALTLGEALTLGVLGGGLGLGATEAALWFLDRRPGLILPGIAALHLKPQVALLAFGTALLLGLAAGAIPAWGAYRARVTDMLRAV
jgi:putative ABC transport system permease protein